MRSFSAYLCGIANAIYMVHKKIENIFEIKLAA